jgi:hypothetical protein
MAHPREKQRRWGNIVFPLFFSTKENGVEIRVSSHCPFLRISRRKTASLDPQQQGELWPCGVVLCP